ncbi:hypothetical protein [Desulfofundulus salinus]|uniref:hypothetical protein n=1 Tax=Desulfofundulus salinus TaxID=2419843 RepID=UPI00140206F4|nr:hypothetical protein [Desulfofundulus salinum]
MLNSAEFVFLYLASQKIGAIGEIIVKAPAKTTYSYVNNPAESERVFYKGWIYIGDLGTWDENEYITAELGALKNQDCECNII